MPGRVYKRGDIFWVAFSHKGKEFRHSAKTESRREAEKVLSHYLGLCAREEFKGFEDTRSIYTVKEMMEDLVQDCILRQLRSVKKVKQRAAHIIREWGQTPAQDLTERHVDVYIKHRMEHVLPATIQRELTYLKQAFRIAKRKKLVPDIPHVPMIKVSNVRQGFFESRDFERFVEALPEYLKDFTRFGYYTGWRFQEIATLQWRDVQDGVVRLRPEISKSAKGRVLVIAGAISEIIERRREARKDLIPWVFYHGNGARLKDVYRSWRTACTRADVVGMLFHDLRRTAVRNMIRAGVPERVAMEISGHKTRSVFDRYNIVNEDDLRAAMQKTQTYLQGKVIPLRPRSDKRGT